MRDLNLDSIESYILWMCDLEIDSAYRALLSLPDMKQSMTSCAER